jgi:hypothetical protein
LWSGVDVVGFGIAFFFFFLGFFLVLFTFRSIRIFLISLIFLTVFRLPEWS